ncbi:MAG TPA: hypothetical protein VIH99_02665 [Bdellovibrionota bacterium]|jgi:hypothetical protein
MSAQEPSQRYLGLELGGSRRTAVLCLEYSHKDKKIFLVESRAHLHGSREETADEVLIRTVNSLSPGKIGVDAPLTFPPCLICEVDECPGSSNCTKESVRWMREESERRRWSKAKFPPPYTHRPVDLLMRGRWQDDAPLPIPAEEAFGSGRAPLTARMSYLRRHLDCKSLLEVSPRYALVGIAPWYGISVRELRRCREMEHGAENRFTILNKLTAKPEFPALPQIVLYMTDLVAIAKDLAAFDALLCALMPIFGDLGLLEAPELDPSWGNIARPKTLPKRQGETWV